MTKSIIAILVTLMLAVVTMILANNAGYKYWSTPPPAKPELIHLICDEAGGFFRGSLLLIQLAKKSDDTYKCLGTDSDYDSQLYHLRELGSYDRMLKILDARPPMTKSHYDEKIRWVEKRKNEFNSASGCIDDWGNLLYVPISQAGESRESVRINRETLTISELEEDILYGGYDEGTMQCRFVTKKQMREQLESIRAKYEEYRATVEAHNPGDTRKL